MAKFPANSADADPAWLSEWTGSWLIASPQAAELFPTSFPASLDEAIKVESKDLEQVPLCSNSVFTSSQLCG